MIFFVSFFLSFFLCLRIKLYLFQKTKSAHITRVKHGGGCITLWECFFFFLSAWAGKLVRRWMKLNTILNENMWPPEVLSQGVIKQLCICLQCIILSLFPNQKPIHFFLYIRSCNVNNLIFIQSGDKNIIFIFHKLIVFGLFYLFSSLLTYFISDSVPQL